MAAASIVNSTPFAADQILVADAQGRDLVVILAQATYAIHGTGTLELESKQPPVNPGGEWFGAPGVSSIRHEPQVAPFKLGTDIVLHGCAYPQRPGDAFVDVTFQVGPVGKMVRVFGDRHWIDGTGNLASHPAPFEAMPLVFERAFGGVDSLPPSGTPSEDAKRRYERRNPLGKGFRHKGPVKGLALPNLEDPRRLIGSVSDRPPPACFGFLGPDWEPRVKLAGTYDEDWMRRRMPLLPADFDARFYNAAHPDLISTVPLRGGEPVRVDHASPRGPLVFPLPSEPAPKAWAEMRGAQDTVFPMHLDTVIVDTLEHQVRLIWRGHFRPDRGVENIEAIGMGEKGEPAPALIFVPADPEEKSQP